MIGFLAGANLRLSHGPFSLRLLSPATDQYPGESVDFVANYAAGSIADKVLVSLPTWYAMTQRIREMSFEGNVSGAWWTDGEVDPDTFELINPDPGQSLNEDLETSGEDPEILFRETGPLQHGFTTPYPNDYDKALGERDIFGPNTNWENDDPDHPEFDPKGLRPFRILANKGISGRKATDHDYMDGPTAFAHAFGYVAVAFGNTTGGIGDYYRADTNEVYMTVSLQMGCGIPSLLRGFEINGRNSSHSPTMANPAAGEVTIAINGYPDIVVPMLLSNWIIRKFFNPGEEAHAHVSFSVGGVLRATRFWEYSTQAGLAVYGESDGAQLLDPLS